MYPITSVEWWKTTYQDVKNVLCSPIYVSAMRAIGVISASIFVITHTRRWTKIAMDQHHFLGINVVILAVVFLYKIWNKYRTDVNVSVFRLGKVLVHYVRMFSENYMAIDPATQNYDELHSRRKMNRKFIRTGIIFVLMQHCLVPRGHLLWVQCMVAFRFFKDVCVAAYDSKDRILNPNTAGAAQGSSEETAANNTGDAAETTDDDDGERVDAAADNENPAELPFRHELLPNVGKTMLVLLVFYKVATMSPLYFGLTGLCFCLIDRVLEKPITNALEFYQFDFFEGLEQFYVTGVLGGTEVLISFVFMTWTLLLHNQYLMLIALYTNVYMTCKEVIHGAIIAALAEWMVLVQFQPATSEELRQLDDVCSICLAQMKKARKTKCNHFFHGHCLRRCLKEKNACPYCNRKLVF